MYEYKGEKEINSMVNEVYHELEIVKDGKVLVRYQTKDLYSGGVYYREIAELIDIEDIDLSNKINIYPNPFVTVLSLKSDLDFTSQDITILNIEGKDVTNQFSLKLTNGNQIKMSSNKSLKKGVYFVVIFSDNYIISKKIVKF